MWPQCEHAGGWWAPLTARAGAGSLCGDSGALSDWLCTHTTGKETAFRQYGWSCVAPSGICVLCPRRSCHTPGRRKRRNPQRRRCRLLRRPRTSSRHHPRQPARPPPRVAPPATHQARVNACLKCSTQLQPGGRGQKAEVLCSEPSLLRQSGSQPPSNQ